MKKQIVAILVAIAVIASLLTVSVLSEEAYKPIIQSVTVSPTEIVNGGEVTFTIIANSNAPVTFSSGLCYHFNNESKWKCQSGPRRFTNIGDDLWKYETAITISEWAPVGTYTFYPISVENEGGLTSDEWLHSMSFNVTRTPVPTPTPPEEEGFGGYRVTPCDAIDVSLENATVTDFLNATNMTTVQVCSKAYYSDTQYIYEGSGDYYFDVGAANLDSWKLEVEDYY